MLKVFWQEPDAPRDSRIIGSCGGQPQLNVGDHSPACLKCGALMPYFFTVDVSDVLPGKLLSLFYCISCTGNTVPEFPATPVSSPISGAEAQEVQKDYRLHLHSAEPRSDDVFSPLIHRPIFGKTPRSNRYQFSKIGGEPTKFWGAEDGNIHKLLLQIRESDDVRFARSSDSPKQSAYKLFDGDPDFIEQEHYILVNGIPVYIFATHDEQAAFLVTGRF